MSVLDARITSSLCSRHVPLVIGSGSGPAIRAALVRSRAKTGNARGVQISEAFCAVLMWARPRRSDGSQPKLNPWLPNYCHHGSMQPCGIPPHRVASPREMIDITTSRTQGSRITFISNPDTYTAQPTRKPVRHLARDPLRLFRGYLHWFATFYALFSSSPAVPKILSCSCRRRS